MKQLGKGPNHRKFMKINAKITTNAKTSEIIKMSNTEYKIKVTVIPEKGKANKKIIEIFTHKYTLLYAVIPAKLFLYSIYKIAILYDFYSTACLVHNYMFVSSMYPAV